MVLSTEDLKSNIIFCDGACTGNPGPGGWGAVVVTPDGQVTELGGAEAPTTNNRMELTGATQALERLKKHPGSVIVFTDSTYVIRGITQWVWGWRQRGWKTAAGGDVVSRDLWERLVRVVSARRELGTIDWRYVRGHIGTPGNERVDEIAVAFTKGQKLNLFSGPLLRYQIPIHDLPEQEPLPEMKPKTEKKAAAHSYLSFVDGVAKRHPSWPECEARVKGRSGARFKKAMSEAEEELILKSWGAKLS